MLHCLRLPWLSVFLTLVACSGNDGADSGVAAQGGSGGSYALGGSAFGGTANGFAGSLPLAGAAGAFTQGGMSGSGTSFGSGGATGGVSANAAAGSTNDAGGADATAKGGASAAGSGSGGHAGAAGASNHGGSGGVSGGGGSAATATFSAIYTTIVTPSCGGTQCHLKRPTPFGYDFSSKSAAYSAWRADVTPGDGANSSLFQVLNLGVMPKGKPSLSVDQLYLVLNWINAGAPNN